MASDLSRRRFLQTSTATLLTTAFGFDLRLAVGCSVVIHTLGDRAKNVKPTVVHIDIVDEVPLISLVLHSLSLTWTRDPFDRLLAAHSSARRVPLCTTDSRIRVHHSLLVPELS